MNTYDVGGEGQFSSAPPMAPGALARRVRGRLGNQAHLGALAQLHPNHPIFRKFPGLAAFIKYKSGTPLPVPHMPPGVLPPGSTQNPPPGPQPGPMPMPSDGPPPGSTTTTGTHSNTPPPPEQYPWMNIPTDLSGLAQSQWGTPENAPAPSGDPRAALRQRLMDRYFTARPQQPKLTSRYALNQFLNQAKQHRMGSSTVLPHRRPMNRPY